jgi:hypothetical protein
MNLHKQTEPITEQKNKDRGTYSFRDNFLLLSCGCEIIFLHPQITHKDTKLCEEHDIRMTNYLRHQSMNLDNF